MINNKTILVTGGTGSFGRKFVEVLLKRYKPKIMLEKHPTLIPRNISLKNIDNYLFEYSYQSKLIHSDDVAIREMWI